MKMDDLAALLPKHDVVASPEVFQQIGTITRLLHDTMQQLGVMPKLQIAAEGLPDARSRLIEATEAGRAKRAEAQRRWKVAQERVNQLLGNAGVHRLHAALDAAMRGLAG